MHVQVNAAAIEKRRSQGWLDEVTTDAERALQLVRECRRARRARSIAFHGNAVLLWCRRASQLQLSLSTHLSLGIEFEFDLHFHFE